MTWTTRPRSDLGDLLAIKAGSGPLVILLHGVGLRAEAWNRQIDALAPAFTVLAPDLPGHGGRAALGSDPVLSDYTDRLAPLLDRPAVVIGHSMGAMIALDLAVRYPDRVRGIAALNAIYRRSAGAQQAVLERSAGLDGVTRADPTATLSRWFGTIQCSERAACRAWLRETDPAGYRAAYAAFAVADAPGDKALRTLATPALFMTGSDEPNSTPAMSAAMAALAPDGQAQVIAGAAHMMPMTHAAPVSAALLPFAGACHR